jgi:tRNA-dihydrouridine synthase B
MAGITNLPFRRLMREHGAALVVSELASSAGMRHGSRNTDRLLALSEGERPVGLQIFGETIEDLVFGAQDVERRGADFVDLNLGCPVPKIVKKGAGAAMCRNPVELGRVLAAMVAAVKIPVTIKIRTGWDAGTRNAHEVVKVAADSGVAWVAVHGRTRAQSYSGCADWDFIGEIKARSAIPVIGNGDLVTPELAVRRWRESGVDAVMIGRGALKNPFIFRDARALLLGEPVSEERDFVGLLARQKVLLDEFFSAELAALHVKKFLGWYATGYPGCKEFRKKIFSLGADAIDQVWDAASEFFEWGAARGRASRDAGELAEPFLMGGHG